MTKRISELPAASPVADTDELELNQSGASRRATRGQIIAGLASAAHQHDLADVSDSGALAALDVVTTAEIDPGAYASAARGGRRHRQRQDHDRAAHRRGDRGATASRPPARPGRGHRRGSSCRPGSHRHRRDRGRGLYLAARGDRRHREHQDHDRAAHRRGDCRARARASAYPGGHHGRGVLLLSSTWWARARSCRTP